MQGTHTNQAAKTTQIQVRTHYVSLCIFCSLLFLLSACQPIQRPNESTLLPDPQSPISQSPNLFNIGGRNLALFCEGTGSPTVILEAGLGGDHTTWELVQPQAAKLSRTCSYDRAGMGESDPASTPRTSTDVVSDLHRLLEIAGEKGPYLLVGHSFGGLHTRLFAATYPDEVTGMILVDAVHEDWWREGAALLPAATANEDSTTAELRRYFTSEGGLPSENSEGIDIATTAEQVRQSGRFGDKPLVVLVAGIPDVLPPGLPEQLQLALVKLLQQDLPQQFVHLSTNSIKVDVPNSGHDIPRQRPDIVVVAIKTLVEISRPGSS